MRFAADRSVEVPPPAASLKRNKNATRLKRHYVAALRKADDERVFEFLGLKGELRNLVYDELLTLQSQACHPQILASCKEINMEASSVLYGKNRIEIRLTLYPLTVNGKACAEISSGDDRETAWPTWLRKIHHLRIEVPRISEFPVFNFIRDTELWAIANSYLPTAVEDVFRQLCEFLAEDHRLRSIRIASAEVSLDYIAYATRTFLYAPRLLGEVQTEYEADTPQGEFEQWVRSEVAATTASEIQHLVHSLKANTLFIRHFNTFQSQQSARMWQPELTDLWTPSAEVFWKDLQRFLDETGWDLDRKDATKAMLPIRQILGALADLSELYEIWARRVGTVWMTLLSIVEACLCNLSDDHIMAPAPIEIAESFVDSLRNYKGLKPYRWRDPLRERINLALNGDWLDDWTKCAIIKQMRQVVRNSGSHSEESDNPEFFQNDVLNAMIDFHKSDIHHLTIAFTGQRYFTRLNLIMGNTMRGIPPRYSWVDVPRGYGETERRLVVKKP